MFYLIANDIITQVVEEKFEIHDDLFWVEAPAAPAGQKAVFKNGTIEFEEIPLNQNKNVSMGFKVGKDLVFCLGTCPANFSVKNENNVPSRYSQYLIGIEGSTGYIKIGQEEIKLDEAGKIYDLSQYKGKELLCGAHDVDAKWVAINPMKSNVDAFTIVGSNSRIIQNTGNGITVFNAKGSVTVNEKILEVNVPTFYQPGDSLNVTVSADSIAVIVHNAQ